MKVVDDIYELRLHTTSAGSIHVQWYVVHTLNLYLNLYLKIYLNIVELEFGISTQPHTRSEYTKWLLSTHLTG